MRNHNNNNQHNNSQTRTEKRPRVWTKKKKNKMNMIVAIVAIRNLWTHKSNSSWRWVNTRLRYTKYRWDLASGRRRQRGRVWRGKWEAQRRVAWPTGDSRAAQQINQPKYAHFMTGILMLDIYIPYKYGKDVVKWTSSLSCAEECQDECFISKIRQTQRVKIKWNSPNKVEFEWNLYCTRLIFQLKLIHNKNVLQKCSNWLVISENFHFPFRKLPLRNVEYANT